MPNYDREKHIAQIQTEISRVIRLARRDLPASVHCENPSTPVGLETELLRSYVYLSTANQKRKYRLLRLQKAHTL